MRQHGFFALLIVSSSALLCGCNRSTEAQPALAPAGGGRHAPGLTGQVSPQAAKAMEQQLRQQKKGD